MLDTTNFLIHKLSLQIFRPMQFEDNTTVFDAVKYILLERICETFHLQIEWDTFSRGGKFRSASGAANIQIASLSSDIRTLWAIRIQVRDANMVKRQWSYQIGISCVRKTRFCVMPLPTAKDIGNTRAKAIFAEIAQNWRNVRKTGSIRKQ